jgi:hypothetical protein
MDWKEGWEKGLEGEGLKRSGGIRNGEKKGAGTGEKEGNMDWREGRECGLERGMGKGIGDKWDIREGKQMGCTLEKEGKGRGEE